MYTNPRLVVQHCDFIASDRKIEGCTNYFFCPCLHNVKQTLSHFPTRPLGPVLQWNLHMQSNAITNQNNASKQNG